MYIIKCRTFTLENRVHVQDCTVATIEDTELMSLGLLLLKLHSLMKHIIFFSSNMVIFGVHNSVCAEPRSTNHDLSITEILAKASPVSYVSFKQITYFGTCLRKKDGGIDQILTEDMEIFNQHQDDQT